MTARQLFEGLRNTEEPCTAVDLAEMFDTTDKTVRKRVDSLLDFPGVRSKDVGRTTVYWHSRVTDAEDRVSGIETPEPPSMSLDEAAMVHEDETRKDRAQARGLWLDRREHIVSQRPVVSDGGAGTRSVMLRVDLATALLSYMDSMEVTWPRVLEDVAFPEGEPLIDLSEWLIPEASYRYYTEEIDLFLTSGGAMVQGLGDLFAHLEEVWGQLDGKVSEDALPDIEALDELLPEFEELLHAGDAFDEFVCEMHGYGWSR